jgi:hypothetical protein
MGKFSEQQKQDYAAQKEPEHAGVEASLETLEWIWDSGIVAVAGDAISFEVYPTPGEVSMHEYLLAGWGCPIGMWMTSSWSLFLIDADICGREFIFRYFDGKTESSERIHS